MNNYSDILKTRYKNAIDKYGDILNERPLIPTKKYGADDFDKFVDDYTPVKPKQGQTTYTVGNKIIDQNNYDYLDSVIEKHVKKHERENKRKHEATLFCVKMKNELKNQNVQIIFENGQVNPLFDEIIKMRTNGDTTFDIQILNGVIAWSVIMEISTYQYDTSEIKMCTLDCPGELARDILKYIT